DTEPIVITATTTLSLVTTITVPTLTHVVNATKSLSSSSASDRASTQTISFPLFTQLSSGEWAVEPRDPNPPAYGIFCTGPDLTVPVYVPPKTTSTGKPTASGRVSISISLTKKGEAAATATDTAETGG